MFRRQFCSGLHWPLDLTTPLRPLESWFLGVICLPCRHVYIVWINILKLPNLLAMITTNIIFYISAVFSGILRYRG